MQLLKTGIDSVLMIYTNATCAGMTMRLFYAACACLFLFSTGDRKIKHWIILPTLFYMAAFLLNPAVFGILVSKGMQGLGSIEVYIRFYYILPVELVVAYCLVRLTEQLKETAKKALFIAFVVLALNTWGDFGYNNGYCVKADNLYDVPNTSVELANCLRDEWGEETKKGLGPDEVTRYLRQVDPSIVLAFGRNGTLSWTEGWEERMNIMKMMVEADEIDYSQLCPSIIEWGADFFIEDTSWKTTGSLDPAVFIPVARVKKDDTADYVVYRCGRADE